MQVFYLQASNVHRATMWFEGFVVGVEGVCQINAAEVDSDDEQTAGSFECH